MQFRKKPVVIEAFRLGFDNIPDWFMDRVTSNEIILHGTRGDLRSAEISTIEGVMVANKGDYAIRGVKGEIYPCKPDIFAEIYENESVPSEFSTLRARLAAIAAAAGLPNDEHLADVLAKRLMEQAAQLGRAIGALRPYLRHQPWCAAEETDCGCACGLSAAIARAESAAADPVAEARGKDRV